MRSWQGLLAGVCGARCVGRAAATPLQTQPSRWSQPSSTHPLGPAGPRTPVSLPHPRSHRWPTLSRVRRPLRRGEHVRATRVPHRDLRPPARPRRDPLRHRGGLRQPQRLARAGPGDHRRDRRERRPGREVPDLHGRHAHHRRPRPAVPHPLGARPVGRAHAPRPLRRGAHPLGVARPDVRACPRVRPAAVLEPLRPERDRAARVAGLRRSTRSPRPSSSTCRSSARWPPRASR